ncbi:MAG: hypothetical protein WC044_02390 [Crocinitomicaceae bacterium]
MEAIAQRPNFSAKLVPPVQFDHLLIYRTDINTKKRVKMLQPFFDEHPAILRWNVDLQDVDNVLRIEISDGSHETDIMTYIHMRGLHCEELEE